MKSIKVLFAPFLERLGFMSVLGILALVGFLLYAPAINYPFVHDDLVFIVGNTDLARWDHLKDIFINPSTPAAESDLVINSYYRPILDVVNKCLFLLFQRIPRGYHLFNILLHILNSFLVYWLALRLSMRKVLSLGIGLFFLIHPVQTETVCAIAGVSNLLSASFCFLSFFFYLKREDLSFFWGRGAYLFLSLFFFLLALFTKESSVMFPLVLLFYEFVYKDLRTQKNKNLSMACSIAPFLCLLIGYFIFRHIVLSRTLLGVLTISNEFWMRLASIPQTLLMYLRILIFPNDLHYYRSIDILKFSLYPLMALFLLGFLFIVSLRLYSKEEKRLAYFGLGLFFVALAPMLNIIPLINEYSLILTSEHFLYVSLFGFLLFIFIFMQRMLILIFKEKAKQVIAASLLFVGVVFVLTAGVQIRYWQGEVPLFRQTLQYHPQFGRVRILLARAYYFEGDQKAAIKEYKKALSIMRSYFQRTKGLKVQGVYRLFIKEIHFELAHCYEAQGEIDRAIDEYRQAESIDSSDDRIYNNLGINYLYIKKFDQAALCFKKALRINPKNVMALNNLAFYYFQKGNLTRAESMLRKVLILDPSSSSAQRNLEEILKAKEDQKDKKLR